MTMCSLNRMLDSNSLTGNLPFEMGTLTNLMELYESKHIIPQNNNVYQGFEFKFPEWRNSTIFQSFNEFNHIVRE